MRGVKLGVIIGQLDASDDQVILLIGRVSAQHQPVHAIVLPFRPVKRDKMPFTLSEGTHAGTYMSFERKKVSTWRHQEATERSDWATLKHGS